MVDALSRAYFVFLLVLSVSALVAGASGPMARVSTIVGSVASPAAVYYGYLNTSLLERLPPGLLIFAGTPAQLRSPVLGTLRGFGTVLVAYPHVDGVPLGLGESFRVRVVEEGWSVEEWVSYVESVIDNYAGLVDGVLLDEVDPAFFTGDPSPFNPLIQNFSRALEEIVDHAHSRGLIVVINGVRAYAGLGDLYIWEGWCSTWRPGGPGPVYSYVGDFFEPHDADSNPYAWVNDYAKLEYLRERGLLSRTIAISYTTPEDPGRAIACYTSAFLVGFAHWAYADPYHFAGGGPVPPMPYYSLGIVWRGGVNPGLGSFEGLTLAGPVRVVVEPGEWRVEYGPGYLSRAWDTVPSDVGDAGSGLDIVGMEVLGDGYTFTVRLTLDSNFTGNAVHLYIDSDANSSTGYRILGMIGADMMVEALSSGYAVLYKYTGDGYSWSWDAVHQVYSYFRGDTIMVSPLEPLPNALLLVATVDQNWSIADYEPQAPLESPASRGPLPFYASWSLARSGSPGTAMARLTPSGLLVEAYNPSGSYSVVNVSLPYKPFIVVQQSPGQPPVRLFEAASLGELFSMERGYYVEKSGSFFNLTVKAGPHDSPIRILAGVPSDVGGILVGGSAREYSPVLLGVYALVGVALLSLFGLHLWGKK